MRDISVVHLFSQFTISRLIEACINIHHLKFRMRYSQVLIQNEIRISQLNLYDIRETLYLPSLFN